MWNPHEHNDEENLRWSWLRAVEWARWPIFISQPIAPIFLLVFNWYEMAIGFILANILWAVFVRHKYVNVFLAYFGVLFVKLKWIFSPVMAFYFYSETEYKNAIIALLWPLVISVIDAFPTTQIGRIQQMFMAVLGYASSDSSVYSSEFRTPYSFPIGTYKLDMSIENCKGLIELTSEEYAVFPREFEGEKIYKASHVSFLGYTWNMEIGTVGGKIYKLALWLEFISQKHANQAAMKVLEYCRSKIGEPTEQQTDLFIWDTADGNTILQTAFAGNRYVVNFFSTSRAVENINLLCHINSVLPW